MLQPIKANTVDVIPQAVVGLSLHQVVGKRSEIATGGDDLDVFEGASFRLDDKLEFAIRHYQGHPDGTSTIYIDCRENDVETITRLIRKILDDLDIPESALRWERRDDPEL